MAALSRPAGARDAAPVALPEIIRSVEAAAGRGPAPGRPTAREILLSLLTDDGAGRSGGRLALLLLLVGLMDGHHDRDTVFHRFLLALSGSDPDPGAGQPAVLRASSSALVRLLLDPGIAARLDPAPASLLILSVSLAERDLSFAIRLGSLKTADRPRTAEISWPLALRLGLFMLQRSNPFHQRNTEVPLAAISEGLSAGCRDRRGGAAHRALVARTGDASGRLSAVAVQAAFEDDPAGTRARLAGTPLQARAVRPPPHTDVVLASDGSEFIGYHRDPRTGGVTGIARERQREVLRGSRRRYRWNNEPVVRARLADATVSPTGLVLFGDDAILAFEFANHPNRTGYATDPFQIHHHGELLVSTDRSAVLKPFPSVHTDAAFLLSGQSNLDNYGHFMINGLFRLAIYDRCYSDAWKIVVPIAKRRFHEQILEYCGYPASSFIFTGQRTGVSARRLDVFEEAPHGLVAANLAEAFRAGLPRPPRGDGARRLYLARPEAADRPLTNEAAIIERLLELDFQVLRPERLPFREQVAAFEAADVIVSPHGSALYTLWFCFGRKRIVEIRTKVATPPARYALLGHQVVQVPSRRAGARDIAGRRRRTFYEADLTALFQAVTWAIGDGP